MWQIVGIVVLGWERVVITLLMHPTMAKMLKSTSQRVTSQWVHPSFIFNLLFWLYLLVAKLCFKLNQIISLTESKSSDCLTKKEFERKVQQSKANILFEKGGRPEGFQYQANKHWTANSKGYSATLRDAISLPYMCAHIWPGILLNFCESNFNCTEVNVP